MLDHVSIAVADFAKASAFYDAVLAALGVSSVWRDTSAIGYGHRNTADADHYTYLTIRVSAPAKSPLCADGRHWCFRAPSRAAVDVFHAQGLAHGGTCGGPPGIRTAYHSSYYAGFLHDPDGNLIEAVCHRV
jgi:catechol 2,3-dioxygenase-like lactoylglutathione lyase family enzyme